MLRVLPDHGEIEPASLAQVRQAKNGKFFEVEDDVSNVARDLRDIDKRLRVRYSEAGGYFVVYCREDWQEPGDGYLVTTCQELDQRLVQRIRKIVDEKYVFSEDLQAVDDEEDAKREHQRYEQVGEIAERLAHALRKDRGMDKGRIFT